MGAEQLRSHYGQSMHLRPQYPDRVVTFIKHCEKHHKLLFRVLVPGAHQGPCKMPQNGSL